MVELGAGGQVPGQPGPELADTVVSPVAVAARAQPPRMAAWAARMGKPCSVAVPRARPAHRSVSDGSPRYWWR